jgi:hypothetical protein
MASASRFRWSVAKEKSSSSLMSLIHFAAPIAKGLKNASVTGDRGRGPPPIHRANWHRAQ